jgi:hypothetical protein
MLWFQINFMASGIWTMEQDLPSSAMFGGSEAEVVSRAEGLGGQ